ncbi:MAG: NIPSNAP family protein [Pirellulaceae bacterium]
MQSRTKIGSLVGMLAISLASFAGGNLVGAEPMSGRVYELRTYTTHTGRLPALEKRFADHTMKLFEKHGMKNEMYWVPTDPKFKDNTLIYVISHASQAAADKSWQAFQEDPEWKAARDASEAGGKIILKVERHYMTKTPWSPEK